MLLLLLLLGSTWCQEYTTPSNLLGPRDFNHHPYEGQYLKEVNPPKPKPTKQGPVLFPNDAPPPPKPPLIVTARPLAEAIKRSELTPDNITSTNSIAESENQIYEKQGFSNRADYYVTPHPVFIPVTGKPVYADFDYSYDYKHPYEGVLKKSRGSGRDNRYDEYEEQTALPPIYKALSDHAKQNVLKIQQSKKVNNYRVKEPNYGDSYPNNKLDKDDDLSDDHNANYAFSYTVRDKHTGDDFSHKQQSSGSATNGEYRVRLPDGRTQIVSYTADENGYKADVRYDDESGNRIDKDQSLNIDEHKYENYQHRPKTYEQVKEVHEYNYKPIEDYRKYEPTAQVYEPVARIREYHPRIADIPYKTPTQNQVDYKVAHNERIDEYNQRIEDQGVGNQNVGYNNPNQDYNYGNYKTNDVKYKNDYKVNEDYSYDTLKDYGDEYSAELEGKQFEYQPHHSKFTQYAPTPEPNKNVGVIIVPNENSLNSVSSTLRPSLESLRNLFLNKIPLNSNIPVQLNVPSTTQSPNHYDDDENVVIIGTPKPSLYTKTEFTTEKNNYQTPSSYLESTIASIRNRNVDFSGAKPVLSGSFIDRINKYLSF